MAQEVFKRTETKYLLTRDKYQKLLQIIAPHLEKDKYFRGTNCSIYFDSDDKYLAIHSLEKPLYKEKVRIRSYNVPKSLNDPIFIEIKKKYKGTGYKRRVSATLGGFYDYLKTGELTTKNPQIKAELDYCFKLYNLKPALYLAYDRLSFTARDDHSFRLTFDHNVRHRQHDLRLEQGDKGELYFENGEIVMEVKVTNAYPLWFTRALAALKIYPASFSKYGRVWQKLERREKLEKTPSPNPVKRIIINQKEYSNV